jgi:ATP-dependent helicase HrpB
MLQSDPTLSDIGAVIFDEFHERSVHADLGLALCLHAQRLVREDLRIIAMSATLDGASVARAIAAPLIQSEGRAFPVATRYRPLRERERLEAAVERVALEALDEDAGDVLVFLPGGAEIRRVVGGLCDRITDTSTSVMPLYGELTGDAQDAAIAASPSGRRKIVVATNIAETSLTIEGVRVVVDSGFARSPRFSPRTGLTRLETVRISKSSADQRRGRAGRVAQGVCYRLWPEGDDAQLAPRNVPEILDADLAPLALELAAAGIQDPLSLFWLDPPSPGPLIQARALLAQLGALDDSWRITAHGRSMAGLPAHPRIAHMLLRSREGAVGAAACDIAALLGGRDILRPAGLGGRIDADLRHRLEVMSGGRASSEARVDADTLRRARQESRMWRDRLGVGGAHANPDDAGSVLALAYPDRIARKRSGQDGRFLMSSGTGAHFDEPQAMGGEEWLVIAETDGRAPESRIFLAAPVALDAIRALATTVEEVRWDDRTERVVASRCTMIGAIVVREQPLPDVPAERFRDALIAEIRRRGVSALKWSEAAQRVRDRLAFLHHTDPSWPDVGDDSLNSSLDEWLGPALGGARSMKEVASIDLVAALLSRLDWKRRALLEELAPSHVEVPSGSRIAIDYSNPAAPALAVRLQEVFGLAQTPSVFGGRVPLALHLLSPAHRPVQVTNDLAAFWRGSYAEVRKEMRGRYPKHDWPEDPSKAAAHRGRRRT